MILRTCLARVVRRLLTAGAISLAVVVAAGADEVPGTGCVGAVAISAPT